MKLNPPSKEWLEKRADMEDQCSSVSCGVEPEKPLTFWERLRMRLFPTKYCRRPEAPPEFQDCLYQTTVTKLDWTDRLRILATGVSVVTVRTATEFEIGRTITNSTFHVGTKKDLLP